MGEIQPVVNGELTTPQPSEGKEPVVAEPEITAPTAQPGEKTDSALLLQSLKEEREKRRLLEEEKSQLAEENELLKNSVPAGDAFSDEGKLLEGKIKSLSSEISELKTEMTKKDLQNSNPIFKEKWEEFEEFRSNSENKGMNLKTAAKAFLIENGLLEPTRKGLERPTGGGQRTPIASGMTAKEVEDLRKNDYRKYSEMVKKGQIKIE